MSLQQKTEYPRIYSNSIEHSKVTSNINNEQIQREKRYFKFFLINNQITSLPTPVYWGAKDVNVIDRSIDTFINKPITFHPTGAHPQPSTAGIIESKYNDKYEFLNAAVNYYNQFGRGKITNIFKPDPNVLQAAITNPDTKVTYEGLGETTDPDFIRMLDENEKLGKPLYVSPGIYATDSTTDENGNIIVKGFVGTHLAVVDEPAHTKPIAYIKKETCKVDGKTCYFKLLTASEVANLNTNFTNSNHMAEHAPSTVTTSSMVEDIHKVGKVPDQEIPNINIDTKVSDSNGKEVASITKTEETIERNKEGKDKEENNGKESSKSSKESKRKQSEENNEDGRVSFTKTEFKELLDGFKNEILSTVEEKQNQKQEATAKVSLVNAFIPRSEQTQPDYDFYNSLPVSSEQLKKILEDSKFNLGKDNKRRNTNILAASHQTVSTYSNDSKSGYVGSSEIHHLHDGEFIPQRYRS